MSHHDQKQAVIPQVYPPPGRGYPPPAEGYPPAAYMPPPPAPHPAKDGSKDLEKAPPVETKDKGDGFWRGWYVIFTQFSKLDYDLMSPLPTIAKESLLIHRSVGGHFRHFDLRKTKRIAEEIRHKNPPSTLQSTQTKSFSSFFSVLLLLPLKMACMRNPTPAIHRTFFLNPSPQLVGAQNLFFFPSFRRNFRFLVKAAAEASPPPPPHPDGCGRRKALTLGTIATCISILSSTSAAFAVEAKKGFNAVLDKKDGYSFLYPFGWQEVIVEGQDKVLKDVIEPLENVSINLVETSKQNVKDLGTPQEIAEILIKKVLAPSSQKTKLLEAAEHEADGKTYYTFEFVAQAPNYTRHALGAIGIGNEVQASATPVDGD
ncbi:hypothetical protein ACLOJK_001678 [Asimina triloba]